MVKGQGQPVLAGVSSSAPDVVGALAVQGFVEAQTIFGTYLKVVVTQWHNWAKQQQKGGPLQPGGQVRIISAGPLNQFPQLAKSRLPSCHDESGKIGPGWFGGTANASGAGAAPPFLAKDQAARRGGRWLRMGFFQFLGTQL